MTINEDSRYDANTECKDENGNYSNHQMKTFEALDVAIHNPSLCLCVHACVLSLRMQQIYVQ